MLPTETGTFGTAIDVTGTSTEYLRAWPSLTQAARMLGVSLSTVSRAMDENGIPKHEVGRRTRKIAPVALLQLAVVYGADVAGVADQAMTIAEQSGVATHLVAAIEADLGRWFEEQAKQAAALPESQLSSLIDAVYAAVGADAAQVIPARAGITGPNGATSVHRPSVEPR
jgi:excisionase family DNA binding protein